MHTPRPLVGVLALALLVGSGTAGFAQEKNGENRSKRPLGPRHSRPIVQKDGKTLLWARGDAKSENAEWFDMTNALVDPKAFQYGIGKDTIPSVENPEFALPGDPKLAAGDIHDDTMVLGFEHNGEAKAYPIFLLSRHEVVNDVIGGKEFAVCW